MNGYRYLCIAVSAMLIPLQLYAQPVKPAARAAGFTLGIDELKSRYALTPRALRQGRSSEQESIEEFLYSVVAEKLWAREAERMGLDSSAFMRGTFSAIERMFLRDALFRDKIDARATVTDIELLREYQKAKTTNLVSFLFSADSLEAVVLHRQLAAGAAFDSLLNARPEKELQPAPLEIGYGNPDRGVERAVFRLPLPGSFSAPYRDNSGWFIFYLRSRGIRKLSRSDDDKLQTDVKKRLKEEKTDSVYQQFYKSFFTGKKAETDGLLFERFVKKVYAALRKQAAQNGVPKLDAAEAASMIRAFGADTLAMPFVTTNDATLPFSSFVYQFMFDGFSSAETREEVVAAQINARVREFIEQELLSAEAARLGYGERRDVKADIALWKDYYLAAQARRAELDSISLPAFDSAGTVTRYNVSLVVTDTLEVIQRLLDALREGADFRKASLAVKPIYRLLDGRGETGLRTAAELGEAGKLLTGMQTGEVRGPLPTQEGFMLIKLLQQQDTTASGGAALREEAARNKYLAHLDRRTAELALAGGLEVLKDDVLRAGLKNQQMLVIRYFGFGGKLTAFPLTVTQTGWVEEWLKRKRELP